MSTTLDEMPQRQDGLEVRVATLEEDTKTQAQRQAAMETDISDFKLEQRAQRGLLQALAITQSEHTSRLISIEGRFFGIDDRLNRVEGRLTGVEDRLTGVEDRLTGVEDRLTSVETDMAEVKNRLINVETDVAQVKSTLGNVQVGVQTIIAILDRQIEETGEDEPPSSDH